MSDTDAAYAAGLFDGEGSIALTRVRAKRWPSPQVSVASGEREVWEWLRTRSGGVITAKKPRHPTHSISYDWKLTDRRALAFLQVVRPFVVIQRKQVRADLLLTAYLACTPRNGRYTPELLERKRALIRQFRSLP
ncbi:MAG: hypothetical protein RMK99_08740 [Anaerolineales bacterium]|nr:hypothetical protein [Anaerolineales bacterium]